MSEKSDFPSRKTNRNSPQINFRLPEDTYHILGLLAEAEGMSTSGFAQSIAKEAIDKEKPRVHKILGIDVDASDAEFMDAYKTFLMMKALKTAGIFDRDEALTRLDNAFGFTQDEPSI